MLGTPCIMGGLSRWVVALMALGFALTSASLRAQGLDRKPAASLGVPTPPPPPKNPPPEGVRDLDEDFRLPEPPLDKSTAPPPPLPKNWQPRQEKYAFGTQFGAALLASKNGLPGYGLTWFPSQGVSNQPGKSLGLARQELALFSPFWQQGPDTAIAFFGLRNSLFNTNARLIDSNKDFPTNLWDVNVGVSYSHTFAEGWTAGLNVNAGSPSDQPFSKADVLTAGVIAYLTTPARANDHWVFGLIYSPTSDFAYPIPGLAYFYQPNDYFEMNVGIPFLLKYRPYDDITLEAFYLPVRTLTMRATWQFLPGTRAFAAFNWYYESYFLADRQNNGDRLYSFEKRLTSGLSFDLPLNFALEISTGYAFNRFYFQGRRYGDRNHDRVGIDPGLFGQLQLRLKF